MFVITNFVQFDRNGRALCPACQSDPLKRYTKKNLSLVPNGGGAYKCHRGCTPEEIREALNAPKVSPSLSRSSTSKQYSPAEIASMTAELLRFPQGLEWLAKRGIDQEQIKLHQLGLLTSTGQKAIAIPYPVDGGYLVKYALVDWSTGTYEFRQPGISKQVWTAKKGNPYFLCEGEWDAIALAKLMGGTPYGVVTGSNGAGTVPNGLPPEGEIFIFYDCDDAGRKGAEAVAKAVGERAKICQVPYIPIDGEKEIPKGYDVRDAIQRGASPHDFLQAIPKGQASPPPTPEPLTPQNGGAIANVKQLQFQTMRELYSHRLRKNTRGYQVEQDGRVIQPDFLYLQCLQEHGIVIGKDKAIDVFNYFATENQYDPVAEYLDGCYAQYGDSTISLLEKASSRYFHTNKPIYDLYLRKTLIAAVKRTFEPGCKFDTALVLFGNQGYGKSTFWRILGGQYFDDTVSGFDQNEIQKLHYFWIEELGEIDKIQNKHDVSIVKAFLSRQTDAFRPVFERSTQKFPRKFIVVGSTNKQELLLDPTGDRRFWIIPVTQPIDLELVRQERDRLWAAAVALYKRGEPIYLPPDLEFAREEENAQFRAEDPWQEPIANFVQDRRTLRTSEILTDLLQIPLERQDRRAQMRVADILRSLGWIKKHTREGKIWEKSTQVVTVVTKTENRDLASDIGSDYLNNKVVTNDPLGSPIPNFGDPVTTVTTTLGKKEIFENPEEREQAILARYYAQEAEQRTLLAQLKGGDVVLLFNEREFLKRFPRASVTTLPLVWRVRQIVDQEEVVISSAKESYQVKRDWLTVPTWEVKVPESEIEETDDWEGIA